MEKKVLVVLEAVVDTSLLAVVGIDCGREERVKRELVNW